MTTAHASSVPTCESDGASGRAVISCSRTITTSTCRWAPDPGRSIPTGYRRRFNTRYVEGLETDLRERLQATLSDAYRLERELGGGGMSRVFLAEELAFGRRVVVKVLSPDLAAGVNFERFKREILVTARLEHPHNVPVFTAGETSGLPYYTMPFVEGESLRVRLLRTGAMPILVAVSMLRDVARALEFAHSRGVVHRDVKPDNILLTDNTATVSRSEE